MYTSKCKFVSKDVVVISLTFIVSMFVIHNCLLPIISNVREHAFRFPSSNVRQEPLDGLVGDRRPLSADQEKDSSFMYRNAPWKSGIGHWLSQCGEAPMISVSERFLSNQCENNCSGRGVCNYDLAECRCFHGFSGKGCERVDEFPCVIEGDFWRPSKCGAFCEKTKAFCLCGEGTKYPRRPVAEECGFVTYNGQVDWKTPDPQIFSTDNSSKEGKGWCNLDPEDHISSSLRLKCDCTYDGAGGRLCDVPVESVCVNQCSGNGQCRGGFCACAEGWHGIDCSVPSSLHSLNEPDRWPTWLESSRVNVSVTDGQEEGNTALQLTLEKRRPLIYVYDLPAKFNNHLLEGRHYRLWCTSRMYDDDNTTIWNDDLYGSEPALLESLLASPHRTTNAEEADFFYVPTLEACARNQADSAPHTDMQSKYLGLRGYFAGSFHKEAYELIKEKYPYWNRSGGRDHIWLFAWDEGACSAPKEIWSSIMLVHWGNMNSKHDYSTSAYRPDQWTRIPTEWRGTHPCYDPSKDIVLPAWKPPNPELIIQKLWARPREERPTLFYFNGNLGSLYPDGRPEQEYSMGLRQKLAEEFGSVPNKKGVTGRQASPDVIVTNVRSGDYGHALSLSRFCGVFPGDGWSGRMEDSMLHGCIPVIVQDGIHLPFENVLNYSAFTVRIAENDLPNLVHILRGINETTVDSMLSVIRKMWQRFTYHNAVKLEAQRQTQRTPNQWEAPWAREYNKLVDDDAFATLIQVLNFKRINRPWQTTSTKVAATNTTQTKDYCGNR